MSSNNRQSVSGTTTAASAAAGAEKTKSILKAADEVKQGTSQMPTFRVDLKYRNTLPPMPFDPYFLNVPFPSDFLSGFRHSTLEKNYKYRIHMNPPQLIDDMIDPLGAEEWARATLLDEKDKALQRKEGAEIKVAKPARVNREAKTWMLKTIYTRENVHRQPTPDLAQETAATSYVVAEEDEYTRRQTIQEQFAMANSGEAPQAPPGKQIKRVLPLLPSRLLREINLHLMRYKVGERIMRDDTDLEKDDAWAVTRALLLHRHSERDDEEEGAKRTNEYTPLSLFLPKKVKSSAAGGDDDDEEDLFAEEEAPADTNTTSVGTTYDTKHVEYVREYQVQKIATKNKNDRIALFFEEDAVRYVELEADSLRLFRIKQPGDNERLEAESNVELTVRLDATREEKKERAKRRRTIEGGDLVLNSTS